MNISRLQVYNLLLALSLNVVTFAGKGTDGQSIERRLKKTPDFLLGQSLSEQGRTLSKAASSSCLGQVLLEAGGVCTTVGHDLVQYEIQATANCPPLSLKGTLIKTKDVAYFLVAKETLSLIN